MGGAEDIPYDVYKNSMNVNFFSPLKITKTIIKSMKLKNKGQIVFFNSGSEKRGLPYSSAYSVGKAALSVYIESLRVELHKTDIDIISIYPGKIKTNLMFKNKKYGNFKIYDTKNSKGPEYVAKEVIKALYAKKYYIYLSLIPRIGVMLSLIFPRMFDKYLSSKIRSK